MKPLVLVVEDEAALQQLLAYNLSARASRSSRRSTATRR